MIESDCLQVGQNLANGGSCYSDLAVVIKDILAYVPLFSNVSWSHVKRGGNVVAHLLSTYSPIVIGDCVWVGGAPKIINDALACDVCENFMVFECGLENIALFL